MKPEDYIEKTTNYMFLTQLGAGVVIILLTVLIHAFVLGGLINFSKNTRDFFEKYFKGYWKMTLITLNVLAVFCSHIVHMWLWALFYYQVDAFTVFEEALYFSTSTFTTVGYGDVLLGKDWRLLGAFQSANGFLLFGWSTAYIFEIMVRLYRKRDFED